MPRSTYYGCGSVAIPSRDREGAGLYMTDVLEQLDLTDWRGGALNATDPLESGKIWFAPGLHFDLSESERQFLSPDCLNGKSKNISYRPNTHALQGANCQGPERQALLEMVERFYSYARTLVTSLCPAYRDDL